MRQILHCDANNFYASVEGLLDKNVLEKPLAIAGDPEKRHGIILAKNDIAKKMGVKTGDVIWEAKKKCPNLIIRPARYHDYLIISEKLFKLYCNYTDRVESFGIDECWLDVTNSLKLFKSAEAIAEEIKNNVKKEIGITLSIGVSFNKTFAKLGSDMKKPDAITILDETNYLNKISNLPVENLLFVGKKTLESLKKIGVYTIGNLATCDKKRLINQFGINGEKLWLYANGKDDSEVRLCYEHYVPKSIGNSTTLPKDINTSQEFEAVAFSLCDMVATRLRRHGLSANTVSLDIKYSDFTHYSKQSQTTNPITSSKDIFLYINKLYLDIIDNTKMIRSISISTLKLEDNHNKQLDFFGDYLLSEKRERLDETLDKLRSKYGYNIIRPASSLRFKSLCIDLKDDEFLPFNKK